MPDFTPVIPADLEPTTRGILTGHGGPLLDLFQLKGLALGIQVGDQLLDAGFQLVLGPHQGLEIHFQPLRPRGPGNL